MSLDSIAYGRTVSGVDRLLVWAWHQQPRWGPFEKDAKTPNPQAAKLEVLEDRTWYQPLLRKFELDRWPEEFPPDKIVLMSPQDLIRARKLKEAELGLIPRFPYHKEDGTLASPESLEAP